jgi:hypothetical protein
MSKSAVVRDASKAASIWSKIDAAVKAKGGSEDALDILDREEGTPLVDVIADILVKDELKTRTRFSVTVDFREPLEKVVAVGQYDYRDDNITAENFPVTGNGQVECEVIFVHFDRDIKSEAAITELEQMGLQPAKIEHLLALGAKHPDLQREFPIICLGSSWVDSDGYRRVPYLALWSAKRNLYLYWFEGGWLRHCRFAAVRPPSPKATEGHSKS